MRRRPLTRPRAALAAALLCLLVGPGPASAESAAEPGCGADSGANSSPEAPLPPPFADAAAAREAIAAGDLAGAAAGLERLRSAADELPAAERARLLIHLGRSQLLLAEGSASRRVGATLAAVEAFQAAASAAREAGELRLESYALGYLGEVYEREGRRDDALTLTRRALLVAVQARAPDATWRWQWQNGRLQRAAGREEEALAQYRLALRTLREVRDLLALQGVTQEIEFRRTVAPIYEEFVDLLLERAARSADGPAQEPLLAEARTALEDLKAAELRDYFRDACLDAQRVAAPDEVPGAVVIYPVMLPDRLELIVSSGGHFARTSVPVERERLVREVRALRRGLQSTVRYRTHSRQLYDWLIRPILPLLPSGGSEDGAVLVFVPGGALRTLPMAALQDRRSGRYLIEQYPIAVTPGLTLTDPRPIDRERATLLAVGLDEAVQGFPSLDHARAEVDAVAKTFQGRKLLNREFVASRLADELSANAWSIVHIATHGEFDADASRSFLLAHDRKLYMDELSRIVGATRFRQTRPLELLTLSACETAAGDDLAALGLAGVALRSGARSALATLWAVNDEATAELMAEFYTQLSDPRVSRARALQRAQRRLLSQEAYAHPTFWSPFLLISSWL